MSKKKVKNKLDVPKSYGLSLEGGDLCHWAHCNRNELMKGLDSRCYRVVPIRLIKEKDWKIIKKLAGL